MCQCVLFAFMDNLAIACISDVPFHFSHFKQYIVRRSISYLKVCSIVPFDGICII